MSSQLPPGFYESLFQEAPIGLALCPLDSGKLVTVNQAYADLLNRTIEETINLSYWQITPRKYKKQEAELLQMVTKRKRYGPYEKEYIRKDGTLIPVRLNCVLIKIEGRKYIWSRVENLLDEKYHTLVAAAKPALILCRLDDGSFVNVNKAFAEMIGYSVEETLKLSFWHLTPKTYKKEEQIQLEKLKSVKGEYGPYQKVYIHKDGHKFPVFLTGIRIRIGGTDYSWSHVEEGYLAEEFDIDKVSNRPIRIESARTRDLEKPIKDS